MKTIKLDAGWLPEPKEFTVYRVLIVGSKRKEIVLQSEDTIGKLNPDTGEFIYTESGGYFPYLLNAKPVPLTALDRERILELFRG